jgi:hypothetical protein
MSISRYEEAKLTAQQERKSSSLFRVWNRRSSENCVSVFNIESDDVR